jgi:hypothetical protein
MYRGNQQFLAKLKATSTDNSLIACLGSMGQRNCALENSKWLTAMIWRVNHKNNHHRLTFYFFI